MGPGVPPTREVKCARITSYLPRVPGSAAFLLRRALERTDDGRMLPSSSRQDPAGSHSSSSISHRGTSIEPEHRHPAHHVDSGGRLLARDVPNSGQPENRKSSSVTTGPAEAVSPTSTPGQTATGASAGISTTIGSSSRSGTSTYHIIVAPAEAPAISTDTTGFGEEGGPEGGGGGDRVAANEADNSKDGKGSGRRRRRTAKARQGFRWHYQAIDATSITDMREGDDWLFQTPPAPSTRGGSSGSGSNATQDQERSFSAPTSSPSSQTTHQRYQVQHLQYLRPPPSRDGGEMASQRRSREKKVKNEAAEANLVSQEGTIEEVRDGRRRREGVGEGGGGGIRRRGGGVVDREDMVGMSSTTAMTGAGRSEERRGTRGEQEQLRDLVSHTDGALGQPTRRDYDVDGEMERDSREQEKDQESEKERNRKKKKQRRKKGKEKECEKESRGEAPTSGGKSEGDFAGSVEHSDRPTTLRSDGSVIVASSVALHRKEDPEQAETRERGPGRLATSTGSTATTSATVADDADTGSSRRKGKEKILSVSSIPDQRELGSAESAGIEGEEDEEAFPDPSFTQMRDGIPPRSSQLLQLTRQYRKLQRIQASLEQDSQASTNNGELALLGSRRDLQHHTGAGSAGELINDIVWTYELNNRGSLFVPMSLDDLLRASSHSAVDVRRASKEQPEDERYRLLKHSCDVLKQLHHDNIVTLRGVVEESNTLCAVMQHVNGISLTAHLEQKGGRLPVVQAWHIFRQISCALAHMHRLHFYHQDLKPENVWIEQPADVRLDGFGRTLDASSGLNREQCREAAAKDVKALGVLLLTMLIGLKDVTTDEELLKRGNYLQHPILTTTGLKEDAELICLLADMLCPDPLQVISMDRVETHPWNANRPLSVNALRQRRLFNNMCSEMQRQSESLSLDLNRHSADNFDIQALSNSPSASAPSSAVSSSSSQQTVGDARSSSSQSSSSHPAGTESSSMQLSRHSGLLHPHSAQTLGVPFPPTSRRHSSVFHQQTMRSAADELFSFHSRPPIPSPSPISTQFSPSTTSTSSSLHPLDPSGSSALSSQGPLRTTRQRSESADSHYYSRGYPSSPLPQSLSLSPSHSPQHSAPSPFYIHSYPGQQELAGLLPFHPQLHPQPDPHRLHPHHHPHHLYHSRLLPRLPLQFSPSSSLSDFYPAPSIYPPSPSASPSMLHPHPHHHHLPMPVPFSPPPPQSPIASISPSYSSSSRPPSRLGISSDPIPSTPIVASSSTSVPLPSRMHMPSSSISLDPAPIASSSSSSTLPSTSTSSSDMREQRSDASTTTSTTARRRNASRKRKNNDSPS